MPEVPSASYRELIRQMEEFFMSIGSLCTRNVITIDQGADLAAAAAVMRDRHVGYLVVLDARRGGQEPVGVITDRDIVVKVIARDVDVHALSVGDAMTPEPLVATDSDDVSTALNRMRSIGVRRIPVVRENGQLVGVLSLDDVVDHLVGQLTDVAGSIRNEQRLERQLRP